MIKSISIIILLLISYESVSGTSITGNKSKAVTRPANSIAVYIGGYDDVTSAKATIAFCDKLTIPCLSVNYNYPAIDGFTAESIYAKLKEKGFELILVVQYTNENNKKVTFMDTRQMQHSGTLRGTGNGNYQYNGTSKETGSEIKMNQRTINHNITVSHVDSNRVVYSGHMNTTRGGIFAGTAGMIKSAMKKLSKDLRKQSLIK